MVEKKSFNFRRRGQETFLAGQGKQRQVDKGKKIDIQYNSHTYE